MATTRSTSSPAARSVYVGSPALSSVHRGHEDGSRPACRADASSANADSSTLAVLADPWQAARAAVVGGWAGDHRVGQVDLHGVTHPEYTATVTLSELADRAGLTAGSKLGSRVAQVLGQLGSTSVR